MIHLYLPIHLYCDINPILRFNSFTSVRKRLISFCAVMRRCTISRNPTSRGFRVGEHRTSLNGPLTRNPLPIPSHFLSPGHSYSSMTVSVLRGGLRDIVQRRITEQKLIRLFRTDVNLLNRNMGFMSQYK